MTAYYGDAIAVANDTFVRNYTRNVANRQGARLRIFGSSITKLLLTTDTCRMITLPARARLWQLWLGTNGAATAGATDVGLYYSGSNADGAVIDADYFATAVVVTSASYADVFNESTTPTQVKRGNYIWELAGLSAEPTTPATSQFDIVLTPSTSFTVAAPIVQLQAFVTLGD